MERVSFIIDVLGKVLTPPEYSFDRLEEYCKSYIKKHPKDCLPRWFLAGLYKDFNKYEDAKKEYRQLQKMGCLTEKERLSFAEVLCRQKDHQGVKQLLVPVIERYPADRNANRCLGISYVRNQEFQKAVVYFEKAIAAGSPQDEDYWYAGLCYDRTGNLEKAEEAYAKGLSINPESKKLRKNLASVYIKKGQRLLDEDAGKRNPAEAEKAFNKALEINPDDPSALKLIRTIKNNDSRINKPKKRKCSPR